MSVTVSRCSARNSNDNEI